jgi:hypothetical protein
VVAHPIGRARQVFAFYRELTQTAPDELTVYFNFFADPVGFQNRAQLADLRVRLR